MRVFFVGVISVQTVIPYLCRNIHAMKKSILVSAMLLCVFSARSQFYTRIGVSYAFPQAGQTLDATGQPYSGNINFATSGQAVKLNGASFAAGGYLTLAAGYMFNDHLGVQLDAHAGIAPALYTSDYDNVLIKKTPFNIRIEQSANMPLLAIPSLIVQSGGPVWNIYSRLGLALPLFTDMTQDQIFSNAPGTGALVVDDITINLKNRFSAGFSAAAGVSYKLNERVRVFGEVNVLSLSIYTKSSEIVSLKENGSPLSLSYISSPLVTTYSKNAVIDTSGTVQPAYSMPFSNVGFHVGFCYTLSDRSRSSGRKSEPVRKPATRRR